MRIANSNSPSGPQDLCSSLLLLPPVLSTILNMQTNTAECLGLLAIQFEADGHPLQAIHCLMAMLGQRLMTDMEARARLNLGRLLMEHTCNLQDAYQHLQRAVRHHQLVHAWHANPHRPHVRHAVHGANPCMRIPRCSLTDQ